MKKTVLAASISIVFLLITGCDSKNQATYNYLDGNGNKYTISEKSLEYMPIDPDSSSSGFYSGGEYKKTKITESDYSSITSLLDETIIDTSIHIENRIMGSGLIILEKNNETISAIIKPHSNKQFRIEQLLNNILAN